MINTIFNLEQVHENHFREREGEGRKRRGSKTRKKKVVGSQFVSSMT